MSAIKCSGCGVERLVNLNGAKPEKYINAHPKCNRCSKKGLVNGGQFKKNVPSWNKGLPRWWDSSTEIKKGQRISPATEFKPGQESWLKGKTHMVDENHPNWKGEKVGYQALHSWIARKLGKPQMCENCGINNAKRFEWANVSREYLRDLGDWIRLCPKCHSNYDRGNILVGRNFKCIV